MAYELGTGYVTVMPSAKGFFSGLSKDAAAAGTSSGGGFASRFGSVLSGGAIAGVAASVFGKVQETISSSLSGAFARADILNSFPKTMQSLGFSAEEAGASIGSIKDHLNGLPSSTQAVASFVKQLTASTGNLSKATDLGLAFNDMMLAAGASTTDAENAMTQFNQMLAAGKVDQQAWNSVVSAAPGQLNQLAKAMLGPTANQRDLYEALKTGKVSMEDFQDAIVDLGKNGAEGITSFAEQAKAGAVGIGTSLDNVRNRVVAAVANVVSHIGVDRIAGAIDAFSSQFSKISDAVIVVMDAVGAAFDTIAPQLNVLPLEVVGTRFSELADAASGLMGSLADLWGRFVEGGAAAELMNGAIWALDSAVNAVVNPLTAAVQWVSDFVARCAENGAVESLASIVSGLIQAFGTVMGAVSEAAMQLVAFVTGSDSASGAADALASALDFARGMVDCLVEAANWLWEHTSVLVPVLGAVAAAVGGWRVFQAVSGFVTAFQSAAGLAAPAANALGGAMTGAVAPMGASVPAILAAAAAVVALGAGVALASAGLWLLAQAAVGIASAGPGAAVALAGLVAAVAGLAVGAAAIAPALTAGAVGLVAFGAAMALVGLSVTLAGAGLLLMSAALPAIAASGVAAAASLAVLAVGVALIGAASLAGSVGIAALGVATAAAAVGVALAGAACLVLSAAVMALGAATLVAGAGVMVLGAGLPLVASSAAAGSAGLLAVGAACAALGAGALVAAAGAVALGAGLVAAGAGALVAMAGVAALGAASLVLGVGLTLCAAGAAMLAAPLTAMAAALPVVAAASLAAAPALAALGVAVGAAGVAVLAASPAFLAFAGAAGPAADAARTLASSVRQTGPAASAAASGLQRMGSAASSAASAASSMGSSLSQAASAGSKMGSAMQSTAGPLSASASSMAKAGAASAAMASAVSRASAQVASSCTRMGSSFSTVVSRATSAASQIRAAFNGMRLHIPSPTLGPLPHFSMSGRFDPATGSVPSISVSWYAKGGIFSAPSVIGVGEAGPEAVVPLDRLPDLVGAKDGGDRVVNNYFDTKVVRSGADLDSAAQVIVRAAMSASVGVM